MFIHVVIISRDFLNSGQVISQKLAPAIKPVLPYSIKLTVWQNVNMAVFCLSYTISRKTCRTNKRNQNDESLLKPFRYPLISYMIDYIYNTVHNNIYNVMDSTRFWSYHGNWFGSNYSVIKQFE